MTRASVATVLGLALLGAPSYGKSPEKGRDSMTTGFGKAQASFRDYAAKALHVAEDHVVVDPIDAEPDQPLPHDVGAAWGFMATPKEHRDREVAGWAIADGTVITLEHNLGLLLQEAGIWTKPPRLGPDALAGQLVWAMGTGHRLDDSVALHVEPNGAGTLSFAIEYNHPPPPRKGKKSWKPGPPEKMKCTITFTPDHRAKLTRTTVTEEPAPQF